MDYLAVLPQILFWIGAVGVTYSYFVYPLVLLALPKRRKARAPDQGELPNVSLIIAAFNEEARIHDKLTNVLELDYPRDRLEIIVASDASTDRTSDIVQTFHGQGILLVENSTRQGKEYAQLLAIRQAQGEILLFSDVAAQIPRDGLRKMVKNFADPKVGAVSSEDRFVSQDGKLVGEGAYLKYEMWLRGLESRANTLIGLTGAFFAVRRKLCEKWDPEITSDLNSAFNCIRQGYIAVTDPEVLCIYPDIKDKRREYQRKLRTIIRGLSAVFRRRELLNPFAYGLSAFQLWSHKLARWAVPWFALLVLISSIALFRDHWVYCAALYVQVALYGVVLVSLLFETFTRFTPVRMMVYWVMVNVAAAHATVLYLLGKRITAWSPSER